MKAKIPAKPSEDEQLRELKVAEVSEQVFSESKACAECVRLQEAEPGSLCKEHLAKAMGF